VSTSLVHGMVVSFRWNELRIVMLERVPLAARVSLRGRAGWWMWTPRDRHVDNR